jgi:hypothetical protein
MLAMVVVALVASAPAAHAREIFQIEFRNCILVHFGYRFFPPGEVVNWEVRQHGKFVDSGSFVALGGREYHFLNIRMRQPLDPDVDAQVIVNGTFKQNRKPGCITPSPVTTAGGPTTVVPLTNPPVNTSPAAPVSVVPLPVANNSTPQNLAFTGSGSGVPTALGILILASGAALIALGLRGPLARRKVPQRVLPPWLHTPVPSRGMRSAGGTSAKSARRNKLPPWIHTAVPNKRRFFRR